VDSLRCPATLDARRGTLRMSDRMSGATTYKWLSGHVVLLVDSSERAVTTHRLDAIEIMVRFPAAKKRLISSPTQ
jgi:hypothetical protein